jgi:uncharacterized protein (DUF1501 family)
VNVYKRREILTALLGAGAASSFAGFNTLTTGIAHAAAKTPDQSYKAMVVVFMSGGNDAYNMIVPTGSDASTGYGAYKQSRADFAVGPQNLGEPVLGHNAYAHGANTDPESYLQGVYNFDDLGIGVNAMMPEFAQLMLDKKAAVVANVGTLVEPVTKSTLLTARLPPFLYAHNHQQRALETGWADNLSAPGWAGRIAEQWHTGADNGVNYGSPLGLNISFGGQTRMMTSPNDRPVVLDPYDNTLFDGAYAGFDTGIFKALNTSGAADPIQRLIRDSNRRAAVISELLADNQNNMGDFSDYRDPYGNSLFATPTPAQLQMSTELSGKLLSSVESAAHMLALGKNTLGLNRQIIYLSLGGFDTHADQLNLHPRLLRELSLAIWSFQTAMDAMNMSEDVTLFTLSDFGRSLGNNGNGTDHGWAGHNLVVGGSVNGGAMIGKMPDLHLGGDSDTGLKGRMIPTIAIDQYLATLCHWFGLSDEETAAIFPNLNNFRTQGSPKIASAYLSELFKSPKRDKGILRRALKALLQL